MKGETIAAIATAPGRGGVAVIRISGPDAFTIAARVVGTLPEAGHFAFRRFLDLDEGLVLTFRAPHSYTGEAVVELHGHGGSVTPRRVLEAVLSAGARLARRGEFTERAFLNGKLDYDQAESVLNLIDAKTNRAADAALSGLRGRLARESQALYHQALELSADLEHALDIDEGELPNDFFKLASSRLTALRKAVAEAVRRSREGKILREGALVVLAGAPNAGKSSLMNALLQENRAIVSDIAGTTRDSIEEWLDLGGWPIRLVDTAGLRKTGDKIEAEGVARSENLIKEADIVLFLSTSLGTDPGKNEVLPVGTDPAKCITVESKCDLGRGQGLNVSVKTGEGIEELKRMIVQRLETLTHSLGEMNGGESAVRLAEVLALLPEQSEDLVILANAVRTATERLGKLIGAEYSADLLDNLFSRFCVGK